MTGYIKHIVNHCIWPFYVLAPDLELLGVLELPDSPFAGHTDTRRVLRHTDWNLIQSVNVKLPANFPDDSALCRRGQPTCTGDFRAFCVNTEVDSVKGILHEAVSRLSCSNKSIPCSYRLRDWNPTRTYFTDTHIPQFFIHSVQSLSSVSHGVFTPSWEFSSPLWFLDVYGCRRVTTRVNYYGPLRFTPRRPRTSWVACKP